MIVYGNAGLWPFVLASPGRDSLQSFLEEHLFPMVWIYSRTYRRDYINAALYFVPTWLTAYFERVGRFREL